MAKNVKAIYDTCARLVKTAESQGNDVDPAVLDALGKAFNDIIEFEKIYLIQCQDKFYGSVLMDLDVGIDFTQQGPVDLKVDRSPFMLGINPLWCSNYKFSEFTGLIINEIIKMVWLHPAAFAQLNHEKDDHKHKLLENASSAASTTIIKRDIRLSPESNEYGSNANGCRLPDGVYTPTSLNAECGVKSADNMPLEYYFNILNKFKKKENTNNGSNGESQENSAAGGSGNNSEQTPGDPNKASTRTNTNGQPCHNWENGDQEELREQITSIVSNAFNSLSEKSRGCLPSSILSQIKALLEPPEINWKQVLRKMIGSVPVPYRKTRTRLNRRQPFRADLCGKLPKRTCNIVCCFDTSGSMSDDDLKYCMNEVFNLIKNYEGHHVTIIECDAEVQRVYQAKSMADVQTKMKGRG